MRDRNSVFVQKTTTTPGAGRRREHDRGRLRRSRERRGERRTPYRMVDLNSKKTKAQSDEQCHGLKHISKNSKNTTNDVPAILEEAPVSQPIGNSLSSKNGVN